MYVKVHAQILDSTLAENYQTRHVFEDLLKLADPTGQVDMTKEAIARRCNVPLNIIEQGIEQLEQPDPYSRSHEHEGRRIVKLDPARGWGWQIVNYELYRNMRDENEKRAYFREYRRARREAGRDCSTNVQSVQSCSTQFSDVHTSISSKHKQEADSVTEAVTCKSEADIAATKPCGKTAKRKSAKTDLRLPDAFALFIDMYEREFQAVPVISYAESGKRLKDLFVQLDRQKIDPLAAMRKAIPRMFADDWGRQMRDIPALCRWWHRWYEPAPPPVAAVSSPEQCRSGFVPPADGVEIRGESMLKQPIPTPTEAAIAVPAQS